MSYSQLRKGRLARHENRQKVELHDRVGESEVSLSTNSNVAGSEAGSEAQLDASGCGITMGSNLLKEAHLEVTEDDGDLGAGEQQNYEDEEEEAEEVVKLVQPDRRQHIENLPDGAHARSLVRV